MLICKITPPASKINKISPFSSTTETLEYMSTIARPYIPGSEENNFNVVYGSVTTDDKGDIKKFNQKESQRMMLTKEELSTWGTNDETLLQIIATKLGVSIVSFHNV